MAGERKIVKDNLKRALLKEFIMNETARAGFGGLDIQRTPMGTRITLYAERPGIVIGRRGASIKELTANVDRGFDLDNPQIEVEEVANPAINAQIMAEKLSSALERGWHFRRAGHSTLRRIMASGAKGALIRLSGKLTSQRHRTEKFKAGHVKYNGEPKNLFVDQGFSTAKLKRGTIGVTVWITDPNAKLPDEIEVLDAKPPAEAAAAPAEEPSVQEPSAEALEAPSEPPIEAPKAEEPPIEAPKAEEPSVEGSKEPGPSEAEIPPEKAEEPAPAEPSLETPPKETPPVVEEAEKAEPEEESPPPALEGPKEPVAEEAAAAPEAEGPPGEEPTEPEPAKEEEPSPEVTEPAPAEPIPSTPAVEAAPIVEDAAKAEPEKRASSRPKGMEGKGPTKKKAPAKKPAKRAAKKPAKRAAKKPAAKKEEAK